jgi:nucleotide-binding universal stress UspA family protein
MSGPIVAGDDGGTAGRDAVALGLRLAALLGTRLEVVTTAHGVPADELTNAASERGAAMLVLGPTHRHALARTLRGTARRVLRDAPCPVAVAPSGFAERPSRPFARIGAGVEPTPEGRLALEVAHEVAARAGGTLLAVGAVLPLAPLAVDDLRDRQPYLDEEQHVVQIALERALADLPAGVPCRAQAVVGDPAVALAAASTEVDLLVCGSRGRGPLRAALLGSVTERLLRRAACPLLLVPTAGASRAHAQPRRRTMRAPVLPPPRG